MKLKLRIALLFFSAYTTYAQQEQLTVSFSSKTVACDSIQKEYALIWKVNGMDSIIDRNVFLACDLSVQFPKNLGTYELRVRTLLFAPIALTFEIKAETQDSINLGTIPFKETISELDEVTITGIQRRFIQVDADKTTVLVENNPVLSVSSAYDAILKIPGIVPYPGGGFAVSGQQAAIYFEGIPSSLSTTDVTNLLKSMPASSVQNIEIISNPGASFDANVSGAILNINTVSKVTKWLSGTVSLNYGLNQNNKITPSLVLSGRRKKFTWQFQAGESYYEASNKSTYNQFYTSFSPIANLYSERNEQYTRSYTYFRPSLTFNLTKKAALIVNYSVSGSSNKTAGFSGTTSSNISPAIDLKADYNTKSTGFNNELSLKYRLNLDTLKRILTITAFGSNYGDQSLRKQSQREMNTSDYSLVKSGSDVQRFYTRADMELPFKKINFYINTGVKYSYYGYNHLGSYNFQSPTDAIFNNPTYNFDIDFDYREDNTAAYIEAKKGFGKKLSVGAGLRAENFTLHQKSNVTVAGQKNYFNLFPSFNAIYRFSSDVNLITTYSRKIGIPGGYQFDPNNTGYVDTYSASSGNSNLSPNFYDNAEIKFTVFDYLQLSAHYTNSSTLNLNEVQVSPNSLQSVQTYRTYKNVSSMSYFMAVPLPFGLFKEGLKFFEGAIDVDEISFLYLYTEIDQTKIKGYNYQNGNKALVTYGVYSQFILPWKIRMNVDYYLTSKGTYQIYDFTKSRSALEIVLSKEFFEKKWRASLSVDDVFNTNQTTSRLSYPNLNFDSYNKNDTRIIWMKLSYSFGRYEKPASDDGGVPAKPNVGL